MSPIQPLPTASPAAMSDRPRPATVRHRAERVLQAAGDTSVFFASAHPPTAEAERGEPRVAFVMVRAHAQRSLFHRVRDVRAATPCEIFAGSQVIGTKMLEGLRSRSDG